MSRAIMRVVDVLMLVAFVFSVVVQLNDPDPWAWVAIYGLGAAACTMVLMERGHWGYPTLVAVIAVGWAVTIAPRVVGQVPFTDMFGAFEMANVGIEESREMYGLLIIAVWMAVLAVRMRRWGPADG
jgi:hypothetical protein